MTLRAPAVLALDREDAVEVPAATAAAQAATRSKDVLPRPVVRALERHGLRTHLEGFADRVAQAAAGLP